MDKEDRYVGYYLYAFAVIAFLVCGHFWPTELKSFGLWVKEYGIHVGVFIGIVLLYRIGIIIEKTAQRIEQIEMYQEEIIHQINSLTPDENRPFPL